MCIRDRNITLKNLKISGYKLGIWAQGVENLRLINVVIENNFDINDVKNDITNLDSENLNVINAQEAAAEQADSIKQGLDFFNTILNVFAGIAIFVGAFIIQNTFRILLLQRTKELSLLRALGTSKRQIYRLVIRDLTKAL